MRITSSLDLYAILGLSHTATQEEIKRAYRQAARRFHPDVNPNSGAAMAFQQISEVYEILNDDVAHAQYRRNRKELGKLPGFNTIYTKSKRVLSIIPEAQVIYVLLEITARRLKQEGVPRRSPLNLALVLDRSKSMAKDGRLDRLKIAAHQIIDQLTPEDRISITTFSDHFDVIIPSTLVDNPAALKASVNLIAPDGATSMFEGLQAAYRQVENNFNQESVNHLILVTDGRTYGDEPQCLELADTAALKGVGISAMGMGDEWNDEFLDELAGRTGGASAFINSPAAVVNFLNDRVRNLTDAFAERMQLTVAPDADVLLERVFRLSPSAQPISSETQPLQLGILDLRRSISVLLQFQMPAKMPEGIRSLLRLDASGEVLSHGKRVLARNIEDISIEISSNPPIEVPPPNLVDALSKMTLYQMQERTEQAIAAGDIAEATRRLENLGTRLLDIGQEELAQEAFNEARRVSQTHMFSESARKNLKFGTRALMPMPANGPNKE